MYTSATLDTALQVESVLISRSSVSRLCRLGIFSALSDLHCLEKHRPTVIQFLKVWGSGILGMQFFLATIPRPMTVSDNFCMNELLAEDSTSLYRLHHLVAMGLYV